MSSLSLLLDLVDELDREPVSSPFYDFGYGLTPYQIQLQPRRHRTRDREPLNAVGGYAWPLLRGLNEAQLAHRARDEPKEGGAGGGAMSAIGKDGFQICMDVAQFKPNELNVKVVDNSVVVEGKHEEREDDHGYISRHFVRRYALPKGYDAEKVVSSLSSDGVLTVNVPKPQPLQDKSNERIIQIQQTGPAHLNIKENQKEEPKANQQISNCGDAAGKGK